MATRNITPRSTGEGGLGTTLLRWATAFINAITCTTINALTITAQAIGFTIAGGTTPKTLTVLDSLTLALGAANLKKFMNAAGADEEWASGFAIKAITRDLSAANENVPYTGLGFKPALAIFMFSPPTGGGQYASWGVSDGTTHLGVAYTADGNKFIPSSDGGTSCIMLQTGAGAFQIATTLSMDTDGLTLAWTKTGSPTGVAKGIIVAWR